MKVLQINTVCGVGSTGRITIDLYNTLKENGHECVIAYGRGEAPKGYKTIKLGSDYDNYRHVAKTRLFDKHGFGSIGATKRFIKDINNINPDIIHIHNIHGYYVNIEILFDYLNKLKRPVVWTLHDCWPFTGHCTYFDYIGCYKWKIGCRNCQQKESYPSSFLFDNSRDNYERKKSLFTSIQRMHLITPSEWLSNIVKDSFLGRYSTTVINNGIDLELFKPTKSNFREINNVNDKFVVLGVANQWTERKGLNYFTQLFNNLDSSYRIVLVGVNNKQREKIPDNILVIPKTNSVIDLAKIYSSADVYLNPTLEDNFPTTNLEALACGLPVITFKTGGSPESIDKTCGKIVEKQDLAGLVLSINEIKENRLQSINCLYRSKLYDKGQIYKQYIDLYKNILI